MEYFKKGEIVGNKRMPEKSFVEMYPITKECEERPPLMIVIPGGGYHHLADHEGKDIAEWCNEKGMDAAVFYYQLQPFDIELLLEELNNWIYSLKNPSNQLDKSINQIGIIGFSAGGHLAALAGTKNHNKPDFLVLSYPVITLEEPFTHEGSRTQLVGAKPSEANRNLYSPDQWVSSDTPPVFLWHTANDQSVAVENSLLFSLELSKKNVPFELHVFPEGRHGLGLAKETPGVDQWPHLLEKWLIKKKKGNKEMHDRKPVIFIVGDSTAAKKLPEKRPEAGWGEYLAEFLNSDITIQNHAINGRSTKSFLEEGHFSEVEKNLQTGDYLFIQFGHNDQKEEDVSRYTHPFSEYQENLSFMIKAAREKGAEPIVFSSVTRRAFLDGQVDENNLGDYPQAAIQLVEEMNVVSVDMFSVTSQLLNTLGEEDSQALFLHLQPGESVHYPEGVADNTHFNENGARTIAKLIMEELKNKSTSLQPYIK